MQGLSASRVVRRARNIFRHFTFRNSESYWIGRYRSGGDAGTAEHMAGARFKAEFLNRFAQEQGVQSVIEFGCGDGAQLALLKFPRYTGYDISPEAIERCRSLIKGDDTKIFDTLGSYDGRTADLALSLDVIYHLVEDDVFDRHMRTLFASARRFVIIFSSCENRKSLTPHIRHRDFRPWVNVNARAWRLQSVVSPPEPRASFANFYIYELTQSAGPTA